MLWPARCDARVRRCSAGRLGGRESAGARGVIRVGDRVCGGVRATLECSCGSRLRTLDHDLSGDGDRGSAVLVVPMLANVGHAHLGGLYASVDLASFSHAAFDSGALGDAPRAIRGMRFALARVPAAEPRRGPVRREVEPVAHDALIHGRRTGAQREECQHEKASCEHAPDEATPVPLCSRGIRQLTSFT